MGALSKSTVSLRWVLIIPFVVQVGATVALTGWLAYRNGQQAIQDLANQLLSQISDRIQQELVTYTQIPPQITQANADALDLQQLDRDNLRSWSQYLYRQSQRDGPVTYIYFGDEQGRYVEIEKKGDRHEFSVQEDSSSDSATYRLNQQGKPEQLLRLIPYDSRQRPWYQAAIASRQPQWTEVYEFATTYPTLGLSFVQPYYDDSGQLQGVLGADFTLQDISRSLNHLEIGQTGVAFIIERNGKLIASSMSESPADENNQQQQVLSVHHPLIRQTANGIKTTFKRFDAINQIYQLQLGTANEQKLVQITPYTDAYGLDWLVVVAIPRADFTAQIQANTRNTVLLCFLSLGIAVGMGVITARWVSHPLEQLGQAIQAMAKGRATPPMGSSPIHEVNLLLGSFSDMGTDLTQSRAQLEAYSHQLEALVEQRTQAHCQAEDKFAKAFHTSPIAIAISTLDDGRYLEVNDRCATLLGLPKAEIVGRTSVELGLWITETDRIAYCQQLNAGPIRNQECQFRNGLGETKTVLISADILELQGQRCIFAITNDISDRKTIEASLQASERQYRDLVQTANCIILRWDVQGRIRFINQYGLNFLGFREADLLGQPVIGTIVPQQESSGRDLVQLMEQIQQNPDQFWLNENENRRNNGQSVWVNWANKAIANDQGQVIEILSVGTDMSDRKRAEEQLRRSEAALITAQRIAHVGNWEADLETQQTTWSTELRCMFGFEPTDSSISYKRALRRLHPQDRHHWRTQWRHLLATGTPYEADFRVVLPNGEIRYIESRCQSIQDEQGTVIRVLGTGLDVTERKQVEAKLKAAKQAADQANQVKSQFLAHMSHELRTPLNAILGFTQLMQRTLKYDPQLFEQSAAKQLGIIQSSGDHLLGLINDVLDMAKIEAGQVVINRQSFHLQALLQSLKALFLLKAHEKGLALAVELAPDLPEWVDTDEAKLRQALINLLSNAIKFTPAGQVTLRVRGAQTLYFEVQDTGLGIPESQLAQLFDAFYQTEAGRQSQTGTGLGLAISQTYVEQLGGTISVRSSLGQGTTFQFDIPVILAEPRENDTPTLSPVIRLAPHQPRYRILVAEDQWASRMLLVNLLKPLGFEVRAAQNGQEAIQIWEAWQPHLIWMDMRMPVMDGYEATRHIRRHGQGQTPTIIALTASALEQERQIILAVGCDDFVRKPFHEQTIFDTLKQFLGVQYVYDEPSPNGQSQMPTTLTPEALCERPLEWLQQLQQAASMADAEWVMELLDGLPSNQADLAGALRQLVQGFHCDRIAELSELAIGLNHD